jgi:DNA-damage-inducible protein D
MEVTEMLQKKLAARNGIVALLRDERVRRALHDERSVYAATDIVAALTDTQHADELWNHLKAREPALADLILVADIVGRDGQPSAVETLDVDGVLRLVQSVDSPRAEQLKTWLARSARERLEESENPELAILRTRRAYEQQGYSRQWIDQRMRSVSARHELTGEWYRRGARHSDEFRALTNELMHAAFGMDVEGYRRYKGLYRTGQNLRDHMTDLELALTSLGETAALTLHRDRHTSGFDHLLADAKDTGEIIARTREEIERRSARPVVSASNHLPASSGSRPSGGPRPHPRERQVTLKSAAA